MLLLFISRSQIQLKDLLRTGNVKGTGPKGNSLMELMKLKPPPDIATPVATATATGQRTLFNHTVIACDYVGGKKSQWT